MPGLQPPLPPALSGEEQGEPLLPPAFAGLLDRSPSEFMASVAALIGGADSDKFILLGHILETEHFILTLTDLLLLTTRQVEDLLVLVGGKPVWRCAFERWLASDFRVVV